MGKVEATDLFIRVLKKKKKKKKKKKIRTLPTLLNGSPTMSRLLSATFLPEVSRWLPPSSVTQLPSRSFSRESQNSSQPCSEERLSSIGTLARVWMRWSSLRLNPT